MQAAALSGLESAQGSRGPSRLGEVAPIDRLLFQYGRVLLRGTLRSAKKVQSFGGQCRTRIFGEGRACSKRFS